MSANPHANGGLLMRPLPLPDFTSYAVPVTTPGGQDAEATRIMGAFLRDVMVRNRAHAQFPRVRPGRDRVQPAAGGAGGDRPHLARRAPVL